MTVIHPIPALYDEYSTTLILGSFPSVKSREQEFFYGHAQNRFWQVLAELLGVETPESVEEKKKLILDNNFALWDVIASCNIEGSSDSSIKNVKVNDIGQIIKKSRINRIFVNGKTAEKFYKRYIEKEIGIKATVLPSTSPANAAWSIEKLKREWVQIL